jgi:Na+/H+ antiporter NhaD/arsenite permease-like protein
MTWIILTIFVLGYIFIVAEHSIKLDKAATALITGVLCWVTYTSNSSDHEHINHQLYEQVGEVAGILFFLIGAMTIVELIDLYDGFQIIIDKIKTNKKRTLLLIITILSFFLSAILDNLTTAIVMTSLTTKILSDKRDRLLTIGMIVIAANTGGAWSPIGDVTTTMLWIGNQITTFGIIKAIFIPSIVATIVPLIYLMFKLEGEFTPIVLKKNTQVNDKERIIIFYAGISLLIFVPVFKTITHLPPFMGMMLAVGILWTITEILHRKKRHSEQKQNSIFAALESIDMPSILFFMGILLAVGALQASGMLQQMAGVLSEKVNNDVVIVTVIGLLSSIFDNVPLVAAIQGMYDLNQYPTGHFFWNYLAFCSGTGGSILIIGSAAGVAAMGIESISFFWYVKNISIAAILGYVAGAVTAVLIG